MVSSHEIKEKNISNKGARMELLLDTADAQAVKELSELLPIAGVTTNPTIITSSKKTPEQVISEMCDVLSPDQLFFMQSIAEDTEGILRDARAISQIRPKNMVVKIPVTHAGFKAIRLAKKEGISVLATAIYSCDQAFMAALEGADYLAPYVNRMESFGDGIQEVRDLLTMLRAYRMDTKVVAASFKNPRQVHELMLSGIQSVTIPPAIAYAMISHPGTATAVADFSHAWEDAFKRNSFE